MIDYKKGLADIKLRLSISDLIRDNILLDYLQIAHISLGTTFYRLPLNAFSLVPEDHEGTDDTITKMATIHLAVTLFSNPDINNEARDVKDDRMVQRIIGNRMRY